SRELVLAARKRGLHRGDGLVDRLAEGLALLVRELADGAAKTADRPALAERRNPRPLQRLLVVRLGDLRERLVLGGLDACPLFRRETHANPGEKERRPPLPKVAPPNPAISRSGLPAGRLDDGREALG